jgi:dTDP-4-amino-4,6-dideoxygalactose transaminase
VVLHYAGYAADMNALQGILGATDIKVVEDCAHAPGASIGSVKCGNFGVAGCFSFFSNKNITTGEGGMLTTNDAEVAAMVKALRSHGMTTPTLDRHKGHAFSYDVIDLGYNYRLDEMRAALGLVQLGKLQVKNARRAQIAGLYRRRLCSVPGLVVPFSAPLGTPAYHIFPVLLPRGVDRRGVMAAMKDDGIQTSIHYRPLHTMTAFQNAAASASLPKLESIAGRILTLPLYPAMREREVDTVTSSLSRAMELHSS